MLFAHSMDLLAIETRPTKMTRDPWFDGVGLRQKIIVTALRAKMSPFISNDDRLLFGFGILDVGDEVAVLLCRAFSWLSS